MLLFVFVSSFNDTFGIRALISDQTALPKMQELQITHADSCTDPYS